MAFSLCFSVVLWCHTTLGIMWQRAQEWQPSNHTHSIIYSTSNVHSKLNKKIPIDFLWTFFIYSGMPLQLCPSLPRFSFSCMLVWMRLISKRGSLPVTCQFNALSKTGWSATCSGTFMLRDVDSNSRIILHFKFECTQISYRFSTQIILTLHFCVMEGLQLVLIK